MEKDFAETSNMLKTIVDYANAVKKVIFSHEIAIRQTHRLTTGPGKSWNLVRPFSRPRMSWKIATVMESHGK